MGESSNIAVQGLIYVLIQRFFFKWQDEQLAFFKEFEKVLLHDYFLDLPYNFPFLFGIVKSLWMG